MTDTRTLDLRQLGDRILALRRASGWSQRRLAEVAGVSHGYIALLELGRLPSPGKFRLDAVARALKMRTADALIASIGQECQDGQDGQDSPTPPHSAAPDSDTAPLDSASAPTPPARSSAAGTLAPATESSKSSASHPGHPLARGWSADLESRPPATESAWEDPVVTNVLGVLDHVRSTSARPLPVFRWGACGDPRDQVSPPDPDRLEYPPPGRETLIGAAGFGVVVKGDSMAGRGIYDGDVVWVNPDRPYALGKVVLALVSDVGGEPGMVVKTYARTEVGECLLSETASGRSPVVCREFKIIGPVVGISSWRLPT